MRLRNIPGSRETIAESSYVVHEEETRAGSWHDIFQNDHPIHIEIGMGKGKFIMALAKAHPEINYVGIEKYSSVLIRALEKMEQEEQPLPNLCFIRMDAENIPKVFAKGEVDRIYLNFSDPWPKDRHAKRRLTSKEFLSRYDQILAGDGRVEFKTDNRPLFDFTLEELEAVGAKPHYVTYDLHASPENADNVETEYERNFSAKGFSICALEVTAPEVLTTPAPTVGTEGTGAGEADGAEP